MSTTAPRSTLNPYLSVWHLISLAPLAPPIIALIFIAFRLGGATTDAQDRVADAKNTLQASCLAAEHAATVGASLPRFLAERANAQMISAVRGTMEGARIGLTLSLTAVQGIIEFIIDIWRSTLLCFIELIIRGGLAVAIAAVTEITDFLNRTLTGISSGIASDIQKANSAIKILVDGFNSIPFAPDVTAPQFAIPSADQLTRIQIPTDFENSLRTLNNTLPTLDDIRNKLDQVLGIPFNLLKKEINDTFFNAQRSFVATPLPVPDASNVTFCDQMDLSVIDDLSNDISGLARIGLGILVGVILVLIIAYAAIQWYTQRSLLMTLHRARDRWFTDNNLYQSEKATQRWEPTDENLLIIHAYIEHPLWSRFIYALGGRFNWSRETTNALGWFGSYVFHQAAMVCLMVGVLGILAVEIQLLAARPLQAQYSAQVATAINDFANTIATNVNATMAAQSKRYADDVNVRIDAAQSAINDDLFGWVNGTTTQLNATLGAFYEDVQDAVNKVFGGTPLSAPAQEFLRCILGTKIASIENALTFLHDNLIIDIPTVRDDALMLSQGSVNEVVKPISTAAVGSGGNDGKEGVISKLVNAYISALEKERIKFAIFLFLWLAVFVIACAVVGWNLWGQQLWWNQRRKRWEKNARNFNDVSPSWQPPSGRESPASSGPKDDKAAPNSLASFIPFGNKRPSWFLRRSRQENLRQRRTSDPSIPRSWDEMLDQREKQRDAGGGGRLAALMNIGKRATRVGKSSDSSTLPIVNYGNAPPAPPPADNDDSGSIWINRVTFWKRPDVPDVPVGVTVPHSRTGSLFDGHDFGVAPPRRHRSKPSLTIDTQRASNTLQLSVPMPMPTLESVAGDSPSNAGTNQGLSANSTGPQTSKSGHIWDMVLPLAPPLPVADPKKLVISPPRPLQPRKPTLPSKPNQYIPLKLDHKSLRSGDTLIPLAPGPSRSAPALPSMSTTIMPIPLHHNFANSPSAALSPVLPLNLSPFRTPDASRHERKHKRTPSAPRLLTLAPTQPEKQPHPAPRSSITVDPFADNASVVPHAPSANPFLTPFDDPNTLNTSKPPTARRSPPPPGLNPFSTPLPGTPGKAL